MPPVAIVTDTCHYLPREVVAEHELHEVSLYVHWNGRADREADLDGFDAYYDNLRTAGTVSPCTSGPACPALTSPPCRRATPSATAPTGCTSSTPPPPAGARASAS